MALKTRWIKQLPASKNDTRGAINVTQLDARPGTWAVLREYRHKTTGYPAATRLRQRYPAYEFAVRSNGKGCTLYGRKIKR